jgi:ubiquinone/menaquinone biosynthesis C-methylase UbiE
MFKKYLEYLYKRTVELNEKNIISQLEINPEAKYLDLGCNDGLETIKRARVIQPKDIYGIEIIRKQAKKAEKRDINVWIGDLNKKWEYPNNYFDVITANQVIEHVSDIDHFITEIKRVLKKGGYAIISTENGSSWHNIFASIMGWQIFSLTNICFKQGGIGNPLGLHRSGKISRSISSLTHKTIFNYCGLKETLEVYDFRVVSYLGSGYHPFFPNLGKFDARHAHYLSIKGIKK